MKTILHVSDWLTIVKAAFLVAMLVTFVFAMMPPGEAPHLFPWDKAEHVLAFYMLTILACAAFPRMGALVIPEILSAFGAGIEFAQALPFVHRDCDFWD